MATIYDGVRVFSAADAAAILAADHNDYQDKMILGMEERERNVSLTGGKAISDWTFFHTLGGTPGMYWHEGVHTASSNLVIPVDLRVGEYVTEGSVYVKGDAAMTGGRLEVRANPITGAGADIQAFDLADDADPWKHAAIYQQSTVGINYTVLAGYDYYFCATNAAAGPVADVWLYSVMLKTQFHAGV